MSLAAQALASAIALLTHASQSGPLTLDEAIAIAEKNAFSIQLQESNVEINRQRIEQAKANLGPRVGLTASYLRYSEAITTDFGGSSFVTQPIESKSAILALTLPVDISGNLNRLVRAARKQADASRFTLRATVNDVRLSVRQVYFATLQAEGLVVVAQQGVTDAEDQLKNAQLLFDQQQIALVDVRRFEAQLKAAQSTLESAKNNLTLAQQQFNFTLARPIETPVELVPITSLPSLPTEATPLVNTAQSQRAEVLALNDTVDALALIRRAREAGMNPSLNVGVQHQRSFGNGGDSTTYGTITLSVPIFDSGLTRAQVREASQNEIQAKINRDEVKLGISQEVRAAISNLMTAKANLENAEEQVKLAEEVYRLAKVRQEAGAGTYVEVIDAETSLTQARNQVVTSRYAYLASYAQLQRAVGSDNLAPLPAPAAGDIK